MSTPHKRREYLRFRWDHTGAIHRRLARAYYSVMRSVPFGIKYRYGSARRRNKPPYIYVTPASTVIQVGAPKDTLDAGRSRGMYLALLVASTGKVVIVEPDPASARAFQQAVNKRELKHVLVRNMAAWSERTSLDMFVDPAHPASNFTGGTVEYDSERLAAYETIEVKADRLDALVEELGLDRVDLVSITTNGAEREILQGLRETMAAGLPYVCLARTGEGYHELMHDFGYDFHSFDDRGYTFRRRHVDGS